MAQKIAAPRSTVWRLALIVLAVGLTYSNSLNGPFILDDELTVIQNEQIRRWWDWRSVLFPERELAVAGRPVVNATFALNYAISGLDVRGYHLVNIAIHLACALLLFGVVRRTLELPSIAAVFRSRARNLALGVALLWGLHPLNSEAVNYVTQRTESLMAMFFLLTVYASIRGLGPRHRLWWASVASASCALGMACKETMVTAPVVVALYDCVFVFGSLKKALRARRPLYACLAASWLVLAAVLSSGPRVHSAGFAVSLHPWTYLLNQAGMITRYLGLTFWPESLVVNYGWPVSLTLRDVMPQMALIGSLVAMTIIGLWRAPKIFFLGAWFFITLAPASSIVPIATEVGAERRMYLPAMALITLVVLGGSWAWRLVCDRWVHSLRARSRVSAAVPAVVLALVATALAATTMARNREYQSALQLAQTVVERYPTPEALHVLGNQLVAAGDRAEGIRRLREATAGNTRAHFSLGFALYSEGKLDEAVEQIEAFIRHEPLLLEVISARILLGQIRAKQGQWPEAQQQYQTVLTMVPGHVEAYGLLAEALVAQKRHQEAIAPYRRYLASRPADVEALTNLGIALVENEQLREATEMFRRAVDVDPSRADSQRNLAVALFDGGDFDGAARHAQRALASRPNDVFLRSLLGRVFARQGKFEESARQFEQVLQLDPSDQYARDALVALKDRMRR